MSAPTRKQGWTRQAQVSSDTHTHTHMPMVCKDPSPMYISVTSKCNLQRSTQWPAHDMAITEHSPPSSVGVANNHIHNKQQDLNHHGIVNGLEVGIRAHKLTGEKAVEPWYSMAGWRQLRSNSLCERILYLEHTDRPIYQTVVTPSGLLHGTHRLGKPWAISWPLDTSSGPICHYHISVLKTR